LTPQHPSLTQYKVHFSRVRKLAYEDCQQIVLAPVRQEPAMLFEVERRFFRSKHMGSKKEEFTLPGHRPTI
jgi:hypothetical protein